MVGAAIAKAFQVERHAVISRRSSIRGDNLISCNPWVNLEVRIAPQFDSTALVDWFDAAVYSSVKFPEKYWYSLSLNRPQILLLPKYSQGDLSRLEILRAMDPALRIPESMEKKLTPDFIASGLPLNQWFACVCPDSTPIDTKPLATIVHELGGRIVVVGPDSDEPLPDLGELVDLRGGDELFLMQCLAIRHARFVLGPVSGWLSLASSFHVPTGAVGRRGVEEYLWRGGDVVGDDYGSVFRTLHDQTADCQAWRPPTREKSTQLRETVRFPLERLKQSVLEFLARPSPRRTVTRPRRPVVVAYLGHNTLGDFCSQNLAAACLAQAFENRELLLAYRTDRPYKDFLASLNPLATEFLRIPADPADTFPIDWFLGKATGQFRDDWLQRGFHDPDLFLVPGMMDLEVGAQPCNVPVFQIPPHLVEPLGKQLVQRGLEPDRWFVALHTRQAAYAYRNDDERMSYRIVDPMSYLPMIHDIISNLGGQVVRIGGPEMTPLGDVPGLIDLSRDNGTIEEQAFAVSRARYFIGSDSGPIVLGALFRTPMVKANAVHTGVQDSPDRVLLKWFGDSQGRCHHPSILERCGALSPRGLYMAEDLCYFDNTPEELLEVSRHMFETTRGIDGWREPGALRVEETGYLDLPLPNRWSRREEIWCCHPVPTSPRGA